MLPWIGPDFGSPSPRTNMDGSSRGAVQSSRCSQQSAIWKQGALIPHIKARQSPRTPLGTSRMVAGVANDVSPLHSWTQIIQGKLILVQQHNQTLHIAHCTLHITHCTLHIAQRLPFCPIPMICSCLLHMTLREPGITGYTFAGPLTCCRNIQMGEGDVL